MSSYRFDNRCEAILEEREKGECLGDMPDLFLIRSHIPQVGRGFGYPLLVRSLVNWDKWYREKLNRANKEHRSSSVLMEV